MKWYWWVLIVILALNGLAVVLIGLFMIFDKLRADSKHTETARKSSRDDTQT